MQFVKKITALLLTVSLTWGCATPPPPQTARRERSSAAAPTDVLDLALVITQETQDYLTSVVKNHGTSNRDSLDIMLSGQPLKAFTIVRNMIKQNFNSVIIVDTIEEAQNSSADVIGVLDMSSHYKEMSILLGVVLLFLTTPLSFWPAYRKKVNPAVAKVDLTLAFKNLQGAQIELFHFMSEKKSGYAGGPVILTGQATDDVVLQLEDALAASAPLAKMARAKNAGTAGFTAVDAARTEFEHRSDVDSPNYKSSPDPNSFALVIGVDQYENIPRAEHAERDARAMREHLLALGFPERNMVLLTGERVGRAALDKYIETWLPGKVNADSKVFVFFSGHGAPDAGSGRAFLVPWDGDPQFLDITGYPVNRLYEKLNALKARQVVLAMDACFSGAGGRSILAKGTRPLITKVDASAVSGGKLVVLAASAGNEVTGTDEKQGHGLFTYHLLKALNDTRGEAALGEIYERLRAPVQDAARRDNRSQTPQLMGASEKNGITLKSSL